MSYALQLAVNQLRDQIDRYGIEVKVEERVIMFADVAHQYKPYTEKRIYLRDLRLAIRMAKETEARERQKKQLTLI